jgi:hypothetical protein
MMYEHAAARAERDRPIFEMQRDLLWRLDSNVTFSLGGAQVQAERFVKDFVTQNWECGKLPLLVREGVWLAGFEVRHSFFSSYLIGITVGPAKPRLLRQRYYSKVECRAK